MNGRISVRVGAICRNGDRILLQRKRPDPFWAVPGGSLEVGETSRAGVRREMSEELGVDVEIGRLLALVETSFELDGVTFQQVGLYYQVDMPPEVTGVASPVSVEETTDLEYRWFSPDELKELDVRPQVFKEALVSGIQDFVHIAN